MGSGSQEGMNVALVRVVTGTRGGRLDEGMSVTLDHRWRRVLSRGSVHDWRVDQSRRCCGRGGVGIVRRVIGSSDTRSHDVQVGESRSRNCDRGGGRRGRRTGGTGDSRLVDKRLMSSRLMKNRRSDASRGALSI
jgi:hypothetical protein